MKLINTVKLEPSDGQETVIRTYDNGGMRERTIRQGDNVVVITSEMYLEFLAAFSARPS